MKKNTWLKRSNAIIVLVGVAGILIVLNAFSTEWFGRLDLTANHLNSLSPYSVVVLRELTETEGGGELLVKVYASRSLPDREKAGPGRERDIRGVEQKLKDFLGEYRTRSDGRMVIEYVEEDIEARAEEAGLQPFVGEKTELTEGEKGRFEMKQYVLGLTLHYKGVMELVPKALEPGLYEYELTRAMLRLRDKVAGQRKLEDMFRVADDLKELAADCFDQVTAYAPKEDGEEELSGIEGLLKPIENREQEAEALVKNRDLVEAACKDLKPRFEEVHAAWAGKHQRFDAFLTGDTHDEKLKGGIQGFALAADKLVQVLLSEAPVPREVGEWKGVIAKVKTDVDAFHKELKESAGQQKLGFLCGRGGFCPIPTETPIFSEDALRAASMQNQQFMQILQYQAQMEQQLRQLLLNIRNQLFRSQDFDVERVEAGTPVPDEIKALVVFGVREDLTPADRYWIDQYLIGGGTVIVFASRYDVNLGLFSEESYMTSDRRSAREPDRYDITAPSTNLWGLLEVWGVTVEPSLVMDASHAGKISLPHVVKRGNMQFQGTKDFEYPLFVHTTEVDQENVLVRSLPGILVPFASPLSFEAPEGVELTAEALVRTSTQAVSFPRPERHRVWEASLKAQEKIALATERAAVVAGEVRAAPEEERNKAGREVKRVVRQALDAAKGSATGFHGLADALAAETDDDGDVTLAGRAMVVVGRFSDLEKRLTDVEDGDLEGMVEIARDAMTEASSVRIELRHLAWKGWTEVFGGEPGDDDPPKLELLPATQIDQAARMAGKGQRTLVLLVEGEFPSVFADGKNLPAGLTDEQKKERLVSGPGRLLVVGSDLGLRLPDPEWIFDGIDPNNFVPGPELVRPQLRVDNWQLRIGQVGRSLSMDGIPFLLNTLDWAVQRMALAEIRAKQNPVRRIRTLESETSRTMIEVAWIGGLPLLFLAFGVGLWQWRRLRRRRIRDHFKKEVF